MTTVPESAHTVNFDAQLTAADVRPAFRAALAQVVERATVSLPSSASRIARAQAIVLAGDVQLLPDGHARVYSQVDGVKTYDTANGSCTCQDFPRAPESWCKHRLAVALLRRTVSELNTLTLDLDDDVLEGDGNRESVRCRAAADGIGNRGEGRSATPDSRLSTPVPSDEPAMGLDPRYVVTIQGRPYVKYAGLLELAHERGLTSLTAQWTFNSDELSLAEAVATFRDGRHFHECGDASPTNVTKQVGPHFRRVALTRALARCLRNALAVDLCAVEELGEHD